MRVPSWAPSLVLATLVLAPGVLAVEPAPGPSVPRELPLASDLASALHGLGSTPRAPSGTFHVMVVSADGPPVTAGPVPFGVLVPFDADARAETGVAGFDLLAGVVPLAPDGSAIVGDGALDAAAGAPLALVVLLASEAESPDLLAARRFGVFATFEHPTLLASASLAVDGRRDGLPREMVLAFPSDVAAGVVAPVAPLAEADAAVAAAERAARDAGVPPAEVVADRAIEAAEAAEAAARAQAEETLAPLVSFAAEVRAWAEGYASDVIAPALPPLAADARPPRVSAAVAAGPWDGRLALDWRASDAPGQATVFGVLAESGENARSLATSAYLDPLPEDGRLSFAMATDAAFELQSSAPALLSAYASGAFPFPYASSTLSILAEQAGTSFHAGAAADAARISNPLGSGLARVERVRFDDGISFGAWIDGAEPTGTLTAAGIDGANEITATIVPSAKAALEIATVGAAVTLESGHLTEGRPDGPLLAFTGVISARSLEVGAGPRGVSFAFQDEGSALGWFRARSGDPVAMLSVEGAPAASRVALRALPGGVPAIDVSAPSTVRDVSGRFDRGGLDGAHADASIHVVDAPGEGIEFESGPATLRVRSLGGPWSSLEILAPFVVDATREISRNDTWHYRDPTRQYEEYPVAHAKGAIETSLAASAPAARLVSAAATRAEVAPVDDSRLALPVLELSTDGYARFAPGSASVSSRGEGDVQFGVGSYPAPPTRHLAWSRAAEDTLAFASWAPSTTTGEAFLYTWISWMGWDGILYARMALVEAAAAGPVAFSPALEASAGSSRAPLVSPAATPAGVLDDIVDFSLFDATVTGTVDKFLRWV